MELISPDGVLVVTPLDEIKLICFVRDLDGPGPSQEKRLFQNRPKSEGLWVRVQFRDNDFLEGIHTNNLLDVAAEGFLLVPPDPSANNQRLFIPRGAIKEMRVVGVIGAGGKRRKAVGEEQIGLFEEA
jgi:hypothetical protein